MDYLNDWSFEVVGELRTEAFLEFHELLFPVFFFFFYDFYGELFVYFS